MYVKVRHTIYVAPQIGMIPKPVWGCPRFGILTQTDLGIPVPIWGLGCFQFFQSCTRSAFSHQKFRQPTHCARKSRIGQTREGVASPHIAD
jgi:hypothetical protein